jgi:predicted permease
MVIAIFPSRATSSIYLFQNLVGDTNCFSYLINCMRIQLPLDGISYLLFSHFRWHQVPFIIFLTLCLFSFLVFFVFCFFFKTMESTNNQKHKTLKITFTFMSTYQNTSSVTNCYAHTNPTLSPWARGALTRESPVHLHAWAT